MKLKLITSKVQFCIVVREQEGPIGDSGNIPVVVVDAGAKGALHLTAPGSRGVPTWKHALYQAATNCGPALEQQQLTQDNVPVILDKCINFIYAHGKQATIICFLIINSILIQNTICNNKKQK